MKRLLLVFAALFVASPAAAQWSTGSATSTVPTTVQTPYTHDFTDLTASAYLDVSSCDALTWAFDGSIGDTSDDARVELDGCSAQNDATCVKIPLPTEGETGAIATSTFAQYVKVRPYVAPTGGDTARATITCSSTAAAAAGTPGTDSITNVELADVDTPADEECYTYEATGNTGEWQACGAGGGLADPGSNGMLSRTALDTTAARTITGDTEIVVTNGDGVAGNPTLSIAASIARDTEVPNNLGDLGNVSEVGFDDGEVLTRIAGSYGGSLLAPTSIDDADTPTDEECATYEATGAQWEWQACGTDDQTAAEVTNTAAGDIVATDVQAAINELDTEKIAAAGDTYTGAHDASAATFEVPNSTAPVSTDCDAANEAGRIHVDTDAPTGQQLYVCEGLAGWVLSSGTGATTDAGTVTHVTGLTDDFAVGGTTNAAGVTFVDEGEGKLYVDELEVRETTGPETIVLKDGTSNAGDDGVTITVPATLSANRTATFQDKTGDVALIESLAGGQTIEIGNQCTDSFNTGGPPQTSGSPDGLCDSDGTTSTKGLVDGYCDSSVHTCDVTEEGESTFSAGNPAAGEFKVRWDDTTGHIVIRDSTGDERALTTRNTAYVTIFEDAVNMVNGNCINMGTRDLLTSGTCRNGAGPGTLYGFAFVGVLVFEKAICQGAGGHNGNGGWNETGDLVALDIEEWDGTSTKIVDLDITQVGMTGSVGKEIDLGWAVTTKDPAMWQVVEDATNTVDTGTALRAYVQCEIVYYSQ